MCFLGVPSARYGPWVCVTLGGSITQGPAGEGAGQAAVEGGSLGGAAVVQSAGVGFVVQGTSNGSVVSPAVTHALE